MKNPTLMFDGPADDDGRRPFTMTWEEPDGVYRPEIDRDGEPVGYRRGQCFRAVPDDYVRSVLESGGQVFDASRGHPVRLYGTAARLTCADCIGWSDAQLLVCGACGRRGDR